MHHRQPRLQNAGILDEQIAYLDFMGRDRLKAQLPSAACSGDDPPVLSNLFDLDAGSAQNITICPCIAECTKATQQGNAHLCHALLRQGPMVISGMLPCEYNPMHWYSEGNREAKWPHGQLNSEALPCRRAGTSYNVCGLCTPAVRHYVLRALARAGVQATDHPVTIQTEPCHFQCTKA